MNRFAASCASLSLCLASCASAASNALDAAAVESFLDDTLPSAMATRHIPGLAVTIVEGATPLVTKGYGVVDVTTRRPVDPQTTLFDVQSVSKLVVSTAVMIAAEHGLVRLDVDVNQYLTGFKIPDTYAAPITLASLMTHTSGLEDRGIGITARTPEAVQPLGLYLAHTLTERVAPPFRNLLYSDQGMSLAAYTIQSATGTPFAEYVQQNILRPLRMEHTFYLQVPRDLKADRASAYSFERGRLIRIPHYYYNIWPTSSLWTTAADMSRFVSAHLQLGELDGIRILSASAMQRLHTRQFTYDPRMPGVCFDFFEHFENGHRLLIHSGGGSGFVSELALAPADGIGYFVTYNGYDGSLIALLRSAFLNRFLPVGRPAPVATKDMTPQQLATYAGWYWSTRYDRRTIGKLSSLIDGYLEVTATSNGLLIGDRSFSPVTPTLFVDQQGGRQDFAAFRRDQQGQVVALLSATSDAPYTRVAWRYSQPAQLAVVGAAMTAFMIMLIYLGALTARRGWRELDWSRICFGALAAGNVACVISLLTELVSSSTPSGAVDFELGISAGLRALLAAITCFAVANLASPVVAAFAWFERRDQPTWITLATLTSITAVAYVWFLDNWNVIGLRF